MFTASDVAVSRINANRFVATSTAECHICTECSQMRECGDRRSCQTSPESVDADRLTGAINRVVAGLCSSEPFVEGTRRGVVIVEGSFVLAIQRFVDLANEFVYWVNSENLNLCKTWHLKGKGLWRPRQGEIDVDFIKRMDAVNTHKLWCELYHEDSFKDLSTVNVPLPNVIDVNVMRKILS